MKFLKKHRSLRTAAVAAILICCLLLTTGCDNPVWNAVESKLPFLSGQTEPPAPVDTGISLNVFRQAMVDTPQFFAVAYFGYHETLDSDLPVDPIEAMREEAPRLCEDLPSCWISPKTGSSVRPATFSASFLWTPMRR